MTFANLLRIDAQSAVTLSSEERHRVTSTVFKVDGPKDRLSDSSGNQTYDGTHAYTYDPWNRLITVSHASRDSSGNLQIGQAAVTMSYDARGRRITKTVANTGQWDCTYHYYLDRDSVVEEQNGSGQTIKQFVWGKPYIDEPLGRVSHAVILTL